MNKWCVKQAQSKVRRRATVTLLQHLAETSRSIAQTAANTRDNLIYQTVAECEERVTLRDQVPQKWAREFNYKNEVVDLNLKI